MARVSDYLLGGDNNWAVDREFAQRATKSFPLLPDVAMENHRFRARTTRFLLESGIRQVVDVGGGVLTSENTHQVADRMVPDCRVAYVECDPVAIAHAEILLDEDGDPDRHIVVHADPGEADALWDGLCDTRIIDVREPLALLMTSAMDELQLWRGDDDRATKTVLRYRELLPVGSHLVISHITTDGVPREIVDQLDDVTRLCPYARGSELVWRSRDDTAALFGDFEIVDPGVVWTAEWRPDEPAVFATPSQSAMLAAVGVKVRR